MKLSTIHALIACLGILLCDGAFADGAQLFKSQLSLANEATALTSEEVKHVSAHRSYPGVRTATVVSIDKNALLNNIITVTLPNGQVLAFTKVADETTPTAVRDSKERARAPTTYRWHGKTPTGVVLAVYVAGGAVTSAFIEGEGINYKIRGVNDTYQVMTDVDNQSITSSSDDQVTPGVKK